FPPKPHSIPSLMTFVDGWCDSTSAASIYEGACCVCGRLTTLSSLFNVDKTSIDLRPITRIGQGVTRKERKHCDEPVEELEGPILYGNSKGDATNLKMCKECLESLKAHRLPHHALANGLWVGNVPAVLRDLNFVEKLLVSAERHNVCVGKVIKGQRKMTANAVVYSQPVGKLYSTLPPSRAEIAECLAILFVGPLIRPVPSQRPRPTLFAVSAS
ncbi:hypothetical protein C2E23DRAFT_707984, partial [Lenzites betulinus]